MELCENDSETVESIKEARAICTHTVQEAETACSAAIRETETRVPPRLSESTGDMPRPSSTWRSKSSKKKVRVRLTFSLLVKLPYMPALWTSEVHW